MTESLRTLDRLRVRARLGDLEIASRRAKVLELVQRLELIDIVDSVLERAAQPMPTELRTLDAIHLASALLWRSAMRTEVVMATHDEALAVAAHAQGLSVIGTAVTRQRIRHRLRANRARHPGCAAKSAEG